MAFKSKSCHISFLLFISIFLFTWLNIKIDFYFTMKTLFQCKVIAPTLTITLERIARNIAYEKEGTKFTMISTFFFFVHTGREEQFVYMKWLRLPKLYIGNESRHLLVSKALVFITFYSRCFALRHWLLNPRFALGMVTFWFFFLVFPSCMRHASVFIQRWIHACRIII